MGTGMSAACTQKDLVGAVGHAVTFPLCHALQQVDLVVWTFNTTFLSSLQQNTTHRQVIVGPQLKRPRLDLVPRNYSLRLSRLELADAGTYRVELHSSEQSQPLLQEYVLRVYEPLPRPIVSKTKWHTENGTCLANLTCSVLQETAVTYSWELANGSWEGPALPTITWRPGSSDQHFVCTARNPVSRNSSHPVSARELCEEPDGQANFLLALLLPLTVLLACVAVIAVVLHLQRRKSGEPAGEKRETLSHNRESAEYDCVLHVPVTPVNTLYSTVQVPQKKDKAPSLPKNPEAPRPVIYDEVI
ncbi:SLAM family member 7-like [Sorex fumeus]|uniref:SLAM family member 7-like n=1 Tax=Sorex fumeus TaxID=62283 RepID=UPI0024AD6F36|nr:SLAM family member 7-like [Sorex fumeus]